MLFTSLKAYFIVAHIHPRLLTPLNNAYIIVAHKNPRIFSVP